MPGSKRSWVLCAWGTRTFSTPGPNCLMQDDAACLNEGSSNATNHAKEVGFDHLRQTPSSLRLFPTANIFRRCLLCSECCWTTRHFASPWSSHVWESFSTCSSSRRCSYEQIHPHHLQSTNIYKLFYKSTYTKARNVFVSLSAHLCEWVYQCITVCLLHPVALFVCRWVSPFTSCNMLMCFKNGCFAMLCWHGWREQLSKSDQFSQQVSVPKLVLSTFTSVLRGTICSSCHARPQNLTGHLNGG